jgi:hypothetical protein
MNKKPGPAPKHPDDRYRTPARQIGRVCAADWQIILEGVESSGMIKTAWMTKVLLREARKELRAALQRSNRQTKKGAESSQDPAPITKRKVSSR